MRRFIPRADYGAAGRDGIEVFKAGLNALYNGKLYPGDLENNPSDQNRSVQLRVNMRTGEVKAVIATRTMGGYRI